jgi:3D (Asp-Asp-Asp) domain-containing protein
MKRSSSIWPVLLICVLAASASADSVKRSLVVTATAYNSVSEQTDAEPHLAAWGDALAPGMKVIAVSQDLIPVGLNRRTPVTIEGFPGTYLVLDKMHKRWERRIDIYMGHDLEAARAWGKRQVEISW